MEKIIISVGLNPYVFSNNLEAGPLMVQLVKEGEKWRLKLASPVVGVSGGASSRYGDYYLGHFSEINSIAKKKRLCHYRCDHFEHQSMVNEYFATMRTSALAKDLNSLQFQLQKLPAISFHDIQKLLKKQLKKVYWDGFSLGNSSVFKRSKKVSAQSWFLQESFQLAKMSLSPVNKRDYGQFLSNMYEYPPRPFVPHYGINKVWGEFWGCEALGVLGVNRIHRYFEETKDWAQMDYERYFPTVDYFQPPFYSRSYQRYKENGAISSGYPDNFYYCETDAGDEWRKAVDWFPDSVERKDNGPLKKAPYVGHNIGCLPKAAYTPYPDPDLD